MECVGNLRGLPITRFGLKLMIQRRRISSAHLVFLHQMRCRQKFIQSTLSCASLVDGDQTPTYLNKSIFRRTPTPSQM